MEELEYLKYKVEDMQDNLVRFYLKELKITKDLLEFIDEKIDTSKQKKLKERA